MSARSDANEHKSSERHFTSQDKDSNLPEIKEKDLGDPEVTEDSRAFIESNEDNATTIIPVVNRPFTG